MGCGGSRHPLQRMKQTRDQNEEWEETMAIVGDDNWLNIGCELGGENSHDSSCSLLILFFRLRRGRERERTASTAAFAHPALFFPRISVPLQTSLTSLLLPNITFFPSHPPKHTLTHCYSGCQHHLLSPPPTQSNQNSDPSFDTDIHQHSYDKNLFSISSIVLIPLPREA